MVNGILVDYMTDTYVYQESLSSLKLLIRQRSRWVQVSLNCLKYLGQIIKTKRLSGGQKLGIYYFLAQPYSGCDHHLFNSNDDYEIDNFNRGYRYPNDNWYLS